MLAGVPFAPVSPAYSLLSQDHGKLRHILGMLTPGLVFASGPAYAQGDRRGRCRPRRRSCSTAGALDGARRRCRSPTLLATAPTAAVDAAHARVGPDTIAKFLFTSGSTKLPKGVINTQRMLCANQQMIRQCFPALARRAAGAGRLAAVEPHLRRQPQRRHRPLQRRHALHRRRQADAGADRRDAAQPARDRADDLLQRAQGLRGDRQRARGRRRRCARRSSAASGCSSSPAPAWRSRSGTSSTASPSRNAASASACSPASA